MKEDILKNIGNQTFP